MIIEEINRRFNLEMVENHVPEVARHQMNIIKDGQIHVQFSHLRIFSVNGVVALHTEILKDYFQRFYAYTP